MLASLLVSDEYPWIKFYKEFANKLLQYKNNRKQLIIKINEIYKDLGFSTMNYKSPDGTIGPLSDVDPFTVISTFNRGLTDYNRHHIADNLGKFLGVNTPTSNKFLGIPVMFNKSYWFISYEDSKDANYINMIWEVFENALKFADEKNNSTQDKFDESFDKVVGKLEMWRLTIGLYWIRPEDFLSLYKMNNRLLETSFKLQIAKSLNGKEYRKLIEKIRSLFNSDNNIHSFPELTYKAYIASQSSDDENRFCFIEKDFNSTTGKRDDAKHLAERFRELCNVLKNHLPDGFDKQYNIKGRPNSIPDKEGNVSYYKYAWCAFVADHALCKEEKKSIQLKVSLYDNTVAVEVWLGNTAREKLCKARQKILKNKPRFLQILKELPSDYTIVIHKEGRNNQEFSINELEHIEPILNLLNDNVEFGIGTSWDKQYLINNSEIINEIDNTFEELMPVYNFLSAYDNTSQEQSYSINDIINDGCFVKESELKSIIEMLENKKNIILQGPPGTGKTYLAKKLAYALVGKKSREQVKAFQFHPNLSYEDFVRGYRPIDGKLDLVDGPFLKLVDKAKCNKQKFVIIIEEINRGNPANILGEMLTLLEADKRVEEESLSLTYTKCDGELIHIPDNLYVIGTMNIADRSIAMVDLALRRRFGFYNIKPTFDDTWKNYVHEKSGMDVKFLDKISKKMKELNKTIEDDELLGSNFKVGHSYVTPSGTISNPEEWFKRIINNEIGPLLEEYWIEEPEKVKKAISNLNDE